MVYNLFSQIFQPYEGMKNIQKVKHMSTTLY